MTGYGSGAYGAGPYGGPAPTLSLSGQGMFGCRLSLDASEPYPKADITGSTVYLTPTKLGPFVAYVSSAGVITWAALDSPLGLSLSGLAANSVHDLYLIDQSGTPALARVSGLGSDIVKYGFRLNALTVAGYLSNGSSVTLGKWRGLYVGSVLISPTAGVARCDASFGQSRQWGVWNWFNQAGITLRAGQPTHVTHGRPLTNTSWSALFGDTANSATVFTGRATTADLRYVQGTYRQTCSGYASIALMGIGWNSTIADPCGTLGSWDTELSPTGSVNIAIGNQTEAMLHVPDAAGVNVATMMNKMISVASDNTESQTSCMFFGDTEHDHILRAEYLG